MAVVRGCCCGVRTQHSPDPRVNRHPLTNTPTTHPNKPTHTPNTNHNTATLQLAKDLEAKKTLLEGRLENATRLCGTYVRICSWCMVY